MMRLKPVILFFMSLLLAFTFFECQQSATEYSTQSNNPSISNVAINASWEIFDTHDHVAGLRGLSVVDDSIIWASGSGGTILKTIDGGKTWNKKVIQGAEKLGFRDIHAFDAHTVLVTSAGTPAKIFKSIDGGENWDETYGNNDERIFFDAFDFWDRQNGIVFSDPLDGHFFILTTSNGGDTWNEVAKENIPPVIEGEAGFAASGTCLTLFGDRHVWIGTGGAAARVFKSEDKGKTWSVHETPIAKGKASMGIFSLAFLDAQRGIAVGGDYQNDKMTKGNAAITKDGGLNWELVESSPPAGYRSCVAYFGEAEKPELIAVGTSGTDYSADGGHTWIPVDTLALNVVAFSKDGKHGFAAGPKGNIAKLRINSKTN